MIVPIDRELIETAPGPHVAAAGAGAASRCCAWRATTACGWTRAPPARRFTWLAQPDQSHRSGYLCVP